MKDKTEFEFVGCLLALRMQEIYFTQDVFRGCYQTNGVTTQFQLLRSISKSGNELQYT